MNDWTVIYKASMPVEGDEPVVVTGEFTPKGVPVVCVNWGGKDFLLTPNDALRLTGYLAASVRAMEPKTKSRKR
jgi:hypothetical protein